MAGWLAQRWAGMPRPTCAALAAAAAAVCLLGLALLIPLSAWAHGGPGATAVEVRPAESVATSPPKASEGQTMAQEGGYEVCYGYDDDYVCYDYGYELDYADY